MAFISIQNTLSTFLTFSRGPVSESRHHAVNIHDVTIDQPEISPYNIDALENIVVLRIEYVIREERT